MIELSKMIIRIDCMRTYSGSVHCKSMKRTVIRKSKKKSSFDKKLIYKSIIPTLVLAVLLPIDILVSVPMYITNPITVPFVSTVLAHIVFYSVNFSLMSRYMNNPPKL